MLTARELLEALLERLRRLIVLTVQDVVGPQVVERLLGPGAVRKIVHQGPRQRLILIGAPELAKRAQIEEAGFGATRRVLEMRREPVDCGCVSLQEKVALRESKLRHLAIVPVHLPSKILKRAPRIRIAMRSEEHLRAPQVRLVTVVDDDVLQRFDRRRGARRRVAQGKLIVDTEKRIGRATSIAGRERRPAEPRQDLVW